MLSPKEAKERFDEVFEERYREYEKKVLGGSVSTSPGDLEAIACEVCRTERIFVTDGYRFWNPFQSDKYHFAKSYSLNSGWKCVAKGLIPIPFKIQESDHIYEQRKIKRLKNRGKYRICPICHKEFIPRRSDAMICPMMACKKAAQKLGLKYRKKVIS